MQHTLGMRRRQPSAKLARDVERLVRRKPPDAPQQGSQIFAVDVLHGEKCLSVDVAHVVHAANIGMRHPPRDPHFVAKTLQQPFVARGFIRQKLQSDCLPQRQIVGAIDLAHAALPQQRDDAIAPRHQPPGKKPSFAHLIFGGAGGSRRRTPR